MYCTVLFKALTQAKAVTPKSWQQYVNFDFLCVGVVYSGEYDVCDVTLSVYPHRASLKNMPGHGGDRTYDRWNTSSPLCSANLATRSGRFEYVSLASSFDINVI
jgi:hypothetical protein